MAASASQRKIDQVLTSARKELESQLGVVRTEMARLAGDEQELTAALAKLGSDGSALASRDGAGRGRSSSRKQAAKLSRRSGNGRRARGRRGASKSTAERVEEVRALLADGPKSRNELAAALKLSPARVQQLLAELGGSVSSRPDGDKRAKLWMISGTTDGASPPKPKRGGRQAKKATATKSRRRAAAAK